MLVIRLLSFLAVVCIVVAALHFYFWRRLVRDTRLGPPWRKIATVVLAALGISVPASLFIGRYLSTPIALPFLWPVYVWMGAMLLVFLLFVSVDLARLLGWMVGRARSPGRRDFDPSRRVALARLTSGAVLAVGGALTVHAIRAATGRVAVREVTVRLGRLPGAMSGTRLVQLTDLHLGHLLGKSFVEDVATRVQALEPDIIAITGDLADAPASRLGAAVEPLARMRARWGTYFVTGNHEYYISDDPVVGAEDWMDELERLGIRVLRSERVRIGSEATGFDLAGVGDWSARSLGVGHRPDLGAALAGRRDADAVVLLAHQPKHIREAVRFGVDLQISGHTHGGQIWPWRYAVSLDQPFVSGLGRLGGTQIYVSRGTGYWGPPMRLGEPAEITLIVLES